MQEHRYNAGQHSRVLVCRNTAEFVCRNTGKGLDNTFSVQEHRYKAGQHNRVIVCRNTGSGLDNTELEPGAW